MGDLTSAQRSELAELQRAAEQLRAPLDKTLCQQQLSALRVRYRHTAAMIARLTGRGRASVNRWECDQSDMTLRDAISYARACGYRIIVERKN